jgi:hypothetical protein
VKGEKIRVVEDKTGHDITRHILLQVIAEQEQFGRPILSTMVLESIIRFYGNPMQGFLRLPGEERRRSCTSRNRCSRSRKSSRARRRHRGRPHARTSRLAKMQDRCSARSCRREKSKDDDEKRS